MPGIWTRRALLLALLVHGLAGAGSVTDDDFLVAAEALSRMTSEEELASGRLFPNFDHIQAVSAALTARVCEGMERGGRATRLGLARPRARRRGAGFDREGRGSVDSAGASRRRGDALLSERGGALRGQS